MTGTILCKYISVIGYDNKINFFVKLSTMSFCWNLLTRCLLLKDAVFVKYAKSVWSGLCLKRIATQLVIKHLRFNELIILVHAMFYLHNTLQNVQQNPLSCT